MLRSFEKHRIPRDLITSGEVSKWNTPWLLADVRRLTKSVFCGHKRGAVTWVALDEDATDAITEQLGDVADFRESAPTLLARQEFSANSAFVTRVEKPSIRRPTDHSRGDAMRVQITEGNLRNNHLYLRDHVHKFPDDVIGGSNKARAAKRDIILDWGGPEPVRTDIDGEDKKFFRARAWVGAFYKLNDAQPGDFVIIEQTGAYRYKVTLQKTA